MKKCIPLLFLSMLTLLSCKKLKELTHFDLKYNCESTIQAGVATMLPFDIFTPEITTESESEFEGHKTAKHLIESIQLKNMTLTITGPEGRNFDFLNALEIYISAEGQEEVLIAEKYNIPDALGNRLSMDIRPEELKPFLIGDAYKLRLKATTDKVVNQDVHLNIATTFRVDANILGL